LKGAAVLSVGQAAGYGLSFIRNLILARALTKEDFGLAAALSMAMSLLELVSQMAFGKQIVQSREGDEPVFQAVGHAVQMTIGIVSAVLVIAGAYPMALAFGVPGLTWAFASLAIVPLARGVMHLDLARFQRRFHYMPGVLNEVVPQGLAAAAAWPLAVWLGDFRAVLWVMLGKELLTVAMSHLLAERPYRWAWKPTQVKQMLVFGWPLLLNGYVMFASQQGDQMIIGAAFSLSDLATYSIAFAISSIPFFVLNQVGSSLMLATLSRHQDDPARFEGHYLRCLEVSVVVAMVLLGPLVVVGGDLVRLLYGSKYAGIGTLMTVFGAIVALRFFRFAPSIAAMSQSDTVNLLLGNIARAVSLPLALLVVSLGTRNVVAVAACGLIGEALAILVSLLRVWKRQGIGLSAHTRSILYLAGWITVGVAMNSLVDGSSLWLEAAAVLVLWAVGAIVSLFVFPDLISLYRRKLADIRIPVMSARR
jgi:O-antigen/teichoic acid export membrane protein